MALSVDLASSVLTAKAQDSTVQGSTAQYREARHSTAQHRAAQHSTERHSTAQHSTAQHSTAQHSTAQHSTASDYSMIITYLIAEYFCLFDLKNLCFLHSGPSRQPPQTIIERLKTLNSKLGLGYMFCRSREPDFLLDIIRSQVRTGTKSIE